MKKILLTKGKYTLVDNEDFENLNKYKWYFGENTKKEYGGYACRVMIVKGKRIHLKMHRVILNTRNGMEVDHIDGNGLNNQRKNLRNCSHSENMKNHKEINKNNTSGIRGVHKVKNKWRATLKINQKIIHLGYFFNKNEAMKVRDKANKEYFGNFVRK